MTREEAEDIIKSCEAATSVRDEFFYFRNNATLQLMSSQFQFLQSLAAIVLAFIAIVLATKAFAFSFWFVLSAIFSIALVIFAMALTRETIDATDNNMKQTDQLLEEDSKALIEKRDQAIRSNNPKIFYDYALTKRSGLKNPEIVETYTGEISMFLFLSGLLFCVKAVLHSYKLLMGLNTQYIILVFCLALLFSMPDWAIKTLHHTSRFLIRFR